MAIRHPDLKCIDHEKVQARAYIQLSPPIISASRWLRMHAGVVTAGQSLWLKVSVFFFFFFFFFFFQTDSAEARSLPTQRWLSKEEATSAAEPSPMNSLPLPST